MTGREELHRLLDHIPETNISATRDFLLTLVDPVERSLASAPEDDESETEQERDAVTRAHRDSGPDTPHEEVLREFGL